MSKHRGQSKLDKCINKPLYQEVNKTNWDDWYIELYEDCPCESKAQLNKREGQIIREIGTLNKRIAGRTTKEFYRENFEQMQQYHKQYRQDNFDKLREKKKQWHRENAAYINENKKQYNRENAERIQAYQKEYYRDNFKKIQEYKKQYRLERQNEKINCECGAIIARCGKYKA
jgi:hypothetical protein